jgi:hypothetical protein
MDHGVFKGAIQKREEDFPREIFGGAFLVLWRESMVVWFC